MLSTYVDDEDRRSLLIPSQIHEYVQGGKIEYAIRDNSMNMIHRYISVWVAYKMNCLPLSNLYKKYLFLIKSYLSLKDENEWHASITKLFKHPSSHLLQRKTR